jgi:hypothetical protein
VRRFSGRPGEEDSIGRERPRDAPERGLPERETAPRPDLASILRLQQGAGNRAVSRLVQTGLTPVTRPTLGRAIGDGGAGLIGRLAKPKASRGAPWKIIGTRVTEAGVEYQLDMRGLAQKWVSGADDGWDLYDEPVDLALVQRIQGLIQPGVATPLPPAPGYQSVNQSAVEFSSPSAAKPVIWSGGAEDCVIVAGYQAVGQMVSLAHVDRLSLDNGGSIVNNSRAGRLIFASKAFASARNAATNGTVQFLMQKCADVGATPEIYNSHMLAVDTRNGAISTQFASPGAELDLFAQAFTGDKGEKDQ